MATVNTDKPVAGVKSNAYIIFDYQGPTDFKFAGVDVSVNKLQIGRRTADGWIVETQSPIQLKGNTDYSLLLAVDGTKVTLTVDGRDPLSHSFDARVLDGSTFGLNTGMVGLGTNNAVSRFDNVQAVRILPQTPDENSPTLPGDADRDGRVGMSDFAVLAVNYNQSGKAWKDGDFNGDGKVNMRDFQILQLNFGRRIDDPPPGPAPTGESVVAAPVPAAGEDAVDVLAAVTTIGTDASRPVSRTRGVTPQAAQHTLDLWELTRGTAPDGSGDLAPVPLSVEDVLAAPLSANGDILTTTGQESEKVTDELDPQPLAIVLQGESVGKGTDDFSLEDAIVDLLQSPLD